MGDPALARRLLALTTVTAVAATCVVTAPSARAERKQKLNPPELLWRSFSLDPRPARTTPARAHQSAGPPSDTLQITPGGTHFPVLLLLGVFLTGLLVVGGGLLMRRIWRPAPEGSAPPDERDVLPVAIAPTQAVSTRVEQCKIRLWCGPDNCQLQAVRTGSEGEEPILFSPYFRLRDDETSGAQAEDALSKLVATLERNGWTIVSRGPSWYQHRLERAD